MTILREPTHKHRFSVFMEPTCPRNTCNDVCGCNDHCGCNDYFRDDECNDICTRDNR